MLRDRQVKSINDIHLSFDDGFRRLHPTDILVHCEYSFHFLWDNFKHAGHSQFFEVVTTTKEIMLFHDLGVVVFRFHDGYNKSSSNCGLSGGLVDRELCFIKQARDLPDVSWHISWIFVFCAAGDEY